MTNNYFGLWTSSRVVAAPSTNTGASAILPFQRWRPFKEAFTPELIADAVAQSQIPVTHCVDPFGGSGTTALAAQFLGIEATTIEVNPFLSDLIEAKLTPYDCDQVKKNFASVIERVCTARESRDHDVVFRGAPETFIEPGVRGRYLFSRRVAERFLAYRSAIQEIRDTSSRRLLRVLLGSIAVDVSNVTTSGKGRRYRRNWLHRQAGPETVDQLFYNHVLMALHDLHRFRKRPTQRYAVLRGDARALTQELREFDLSVFSPPYPNSFDYTDVYNVELWTLGYLRSPKANLALRASTLRSHVQFGFDFTVAPIAVSSLTQTMRRLEAIRTTLWDRRIPEMVAAYFDDLHSVLRNMFRPLRRKGRIYAVIGDSRYAGVQIPVGIIVSDIAKDIGYSVQCREPFRAMRLSPQQGGEFRLSEWLIVLEKP
jgi:hypothetical protein